MKTVVIDINDIRYTAKVLAIKRFRLYRSRNTGLNINKCEKDILIGLSGEKGMCKILSEAGIRVIKNDRDIHDRGNRFNAGDIVVIGRRNGYSSKPVRVGVKSTDKDSWVFQNEDQQRYEFSALTKVTLLEGDNAQVTCVKILPSDEVKKQLKPMRLSSLRGNKKAIYESDIQVSRRQIPRC